MANFLAPIINDQQENSNGAPLSGGAIEVYLAGSSTPTTTYSDQAGLNPNTWPIVLNTLGVNNQGAVWLPGGFTYKFVIKDSTGVVQRTIDNVQGINDSTSTLDQWIQFPATPTYVSATSFTVAGDQRQIFQIRRRLKSINTGGTIYSTVTNSTYLAPNTTVTVSNDSGVLDTGLSQVFYGIISPLNSSLPSGLLIGVQVFNANGTYTPTPGTLSIIVEAIGGGGGGGGVGATGAGNAAAGGGGGSGAFAKARLTSGFSGAAVVIGAAGAGGVGTVIGGNGGQTSFGGTMLVAVGGLAGSNASNLAPPIYGPPGVGGGSATTTGAAMVLAIGQMGLAGLASGTAGGDGGSGAPSVYGGGGTPGYATTGGSPGPNTGAGGGGCFNPQSTGAARTGGAGAAGKVIVWEYA